MKIIYTFKAENDLRQIAEYIALDNIDRAIAYIEKIKKEVSLLSGFPNIGGKPKYYTLSDKSCKILIIDDYNVVYKINEETQTVEIHRIINSAMMHDIVEI